MSPRTPTWRTAAWLSWTLVVAYSLAPFDVTVSALRPIFDNPGLAALPTDLARDLPFHAIAYLLAGVADRLGFGGGGRRAVLLCLGIEAGQLFVPLRHATLLDLVLNTTASLAGRSVAPALWRGALDWVGRPKAARAARALGRSAVWCWALFWGGLLLLPMRLVTLDGWDPSYPVFVGDEVGGERPWSGQIQYVGIYGRALDRDEVQRAGAEPPWTHGGSEARSRMGLLAGYDFTEAGRLEVNPEGAAAGVAPRLHVPPESTWRENGLVFGGGAPVTSVESAAGLSERVAAGDRFTVEVWCRPASTFQQGPARIVGMSDGPFRRNFTLGEEGAALVFRVRNALNGPNGTGYELQSPPVLSGGPVRIVATYTRGVSSIFVEGSRVAAVDLREPAALLGLGTLAAGSAAAGAIAALSLILVAPASMAGLGFGRSVIRLFAIGYAVLLIPAALSPVTGYRPATTLYAWLGPALLVGALISLRTSNSRE
jgi:hypothetical protein